MMRNAVPSTTRPARLAALMLTAACGVAEPRVDPDPVEPVGIWQYDDPGVLEITLELAADGSFERIEADRVAETCGRRAGSWRVDGTSLILDIASRDGAPATGSETVPFQRDGGALTLTSGGASTVYVPVTTMPTCVDYGWGAWTGRLEAEVDGVPVTFPEWRVELDVDRGTLEVRALPCDTCGDEDPALVLEIDGTPEALEPATYTVQNLPPVFRSFFGLYHPDPGDPDFQGFTTERLSPPGEFVLTEIGDQRIRASFFFRGNPRADGEADADGRTTVLVTEGVVDLTYR